MPTKPESSTLNDCIGPNALTIWTISTRRRRRKFANGAAELKNLSEQLGTGDPAALAVKQQMAMQDFVEAKSEEARVQSELRRAIEEAKIKIASYQAKGKEASSPTALQSVADLDPVYVKLQESLTGLGNQYAYGSSVVKPGSAQAQAQRESYERSRAAVEEQLDAQRNMLVERLQTTKQSEQAALEVEIKQLLGQIEQLKEQHKQLVKDFESKKKIANTFGTSSIDVEMMRNGIEDWVASSAPSPMNANICKSNPMLRLGSKSSNLPRHPRPRTNRTRRRIRSSPESSGCWPRSGCCSGGMCEHGGSTRSATCRAGWD